MPRFEVGSSDAPPIEVEAANWLSALGEGLASLGLIQEIERLACEVLPNGRVLARNVRTGRGYVVSPINVTTDGPAPLPPWSDNSMVMMDTISPDLEMEADDDDDSHYLESLPPDYTDDEPTTDVLARALSDLVEPTTATSRLINRIDRVRTAPSDLMAWHEALDCAQALVPCEAGAALELEEDGTLRFLHATGPQAAGVQGAVLPQGTGIVGFSVARRASLLVQDPSKDPRFCSDLDEVTGFSTSAIICVPVAFDDKVFGCLELLNPVLPGGFDREQVDVVEMVADALADRLADRA